MASKWLDQFLGKHSRSFTQDEITKSKFGEYFEHLQLNLDKLVEETCWLRSANEILSLDIETDDLESFLNQLLHILPDFDFEFRRIILRSEDEGINTFTGVDNSAKDLSYLDSQIIKILENNERIFINDTSKIHTLKFLPDKTIPKSVLGISIKVISGWDCYLWYADTREVILSKDQVDGLDLIKGASAISISRMINTQSLGKEYQLLNSAINQIPYPCLIFNGKEIFSINYEAEKILRSDEHQEKSNLKDLIVTSIKQNKTHLEINGRSFRLGYSMLDASNTSEAIFIFLVNENEITVQRKYLNQVMQAISLNIVTPLNNILGFSGMIPLLGDIESSQQDYLNRITHEVRNCLSYSKDLLEVSRFSAEEPFITREVSVGDLTSNFIEVSHHLLRQNRISIENKIENTDQIVTVDIPLFGQAFYLVLEYILDQLDSGKMIMISSGTEKGEFWYRLSDNGKGKSDIDVALLNQQEPDSSIDPRIRVAGTIMRLSGGKFTISSELGKGSEYTFSWHKN